MIAAERALAEATLLRSQGTAESLGKAVQKFEEAASLLRTLGDRGREGQMLNFIGVIYQSLGDKNKAMDYFNRSLSLMQAAGDRVGEATSVLNIGLVYDSLGDKQRSMDAYNRSIELIKGTGDRGLEAQALHNIGVVYSSLGDKKRALDHFTRALPMRQEALEDRLVCLVVELSAHPEQLGVSLPAEGFPGRAL